MSLTRPPIMTEEQMRKIVESGAHITVSDPRITSATNWLLGAIAAGLLTGFVSMWSAINSLKEQNATLIAQVGYMQRVNDAQDARLSIYDERLRAIERSR